MNAFNKNVHYIMLVLYHLPVIHSSSSRLRAILLTGFGSSRIKLDKFKLKTMKPNPVNI